MERRLTHFAVSNIDPSRCGLFVDPVDVGPFVFVDLSPPCVVVATP